MGIKTRELYQTDLFLEDGATAMFGRIFVSSSVPLLSVEGSTNDVPSEGTANILFPIRVSGTKKFGITARHLVIARLQGASPTQSRVYRRIPVFTKAFFDTAMSTIGAPVVYESLSDWFLIGGVQERYRLYQSDV